MSVEPEKPWPYYVPRAESLVVPAGADHWARNDVDRFIADSLQQHGLRPAPEATRATLIRRLYFDFLGLPPSPNEVEAFVHSTEEDAYSKLVDRLLEDPRYGERWARFWLDLARYADTAGYEGDPDLPHAWRYRDYVIDAFNNDKPYDLFIREQLAGDEFQEVMGAGDLPDTPAERVVAMTFLRLAPFTEPRGDESRHEMLSEMTSTVGSVFLGLTVGCAKCHDHKHDDIPTADFYRMKAFFATVQLPRPERGDIYQIGGSLDADFYRDGEAKWAETKRQELEEQARHAPQALTDLRKRVSERIGVPLREGAGFGVQFMAGGRNDYIFQQRDVHDAKLHWSVINASDKEWSMLTDGQSATTGRLSGSNQGQWFAGLPALSHLSLGQHTAGGGDPRGGEHRGKIAELMLFDRPLSKLDLVRLGRYVREKYGLPGEATKEASTPDPSHLDARLRLWFDASDLDANQETANPPVNTPVAEWIDQVKGLVIRQADGELQPRIESVREGVDAVAFDKDFLLGRLERPDFRNDKQGAIVLVYSATHEHEGYGLEIGGDGAFLSTFVNPSAAVGEDKIDQLFRGGDSRLTAEERQRFEFLSTRERFTKQHLKRLRPVAMSLRHSYGPPYEPGVPTSHIMIRGEHDQLGEVVEPGFLSAITGHQNPAPIRLDPFKRWPTRSRRMTLANWIASADNPMTARVMVNRLWYWHFGQGIVSTPSDFGDLSGGPSHQALLDWLAVQFVERKWSIKEMHRLIANSATYRQSSAHRNDRAATIDPDNRLLWRFRRRRLDAESIRDSVLAVSGRLNPEPFGLPIFPPLPGDVAKAVTYNQSKWDTQHGHEGRKRSIYIYQQRTLSMPFLQTFDAIVCDESRPRRRASVTALQALAMYNGEFVNGEAQHFAKRVKDAAGGDPTSQIQYAFLLALGRPPDAAEVARMRELMRPEQAGLVGVCRVLLNANEFIYID